MHCRFVRNPDVCLDRLISVESITAPRGGLALYSPDNAPQDRTSQSNSFHLTERNLVLCPVVELVVRGDSRPAICWASSSRPSFSR
jgi:hypothetical protein